MKSTQECSPIGLCADCVHGRRIESDRGAAFLLCELSATDPAFPKYPALPVIRCAGYARKADRNPGAKREPSD